jgi:hypothetical protein
MILEWPITSLAAMQQFFQSWQGGHARCWPKAGNLIASTTIMAHWSTA